MHFRESIITINQISRSQLGILLKKYPSTKLLTPPKQEQKCLKIILVDSTLS